MAAKMCYAVGVVRERVNGHQARKKMPPRCEPWFSHHSFLTLSSRQQIEIKENYSKIFKIISHENEKSIERESSHKLSTSAMKYCCEKSYNIYVEKFKIIIIIPKKKHFIPILFSFSRECNHRTCCTTLSHAIRPRSWRKNERIGRITPKYQRQKAEKSYQ